MAGVTAASTPEAEHPHPSRRLALNAQRLHTIQQPTIAIPKTAIGSPAEPEVPVGATGPLAQPMVKHGLIGRSHRPTTPSPFLSRRSNA